MISNKLIVLMFTAKIRKKYHIATVALLPIPKRAVPSK